MFGGTAPNTLATLDVFDLTTNTWSTITPQGAWPPGRHATTMAALTDELVIMYGGAVDDAGTVCLC